jgi:RHS repeat-associated protein
VPELLAETTASTGESYSYIYGPDGSPVEQIAADGTTVFLHHDQLGSTRLETNTNGDAVGAWTYNVHGIPTASTNAPVIHLGFAGEYTDNETGFVNLRARFYDPNTGSFLSRDPLNELTRSAYGYVYDNPLNLLDPSGENPFGHFVSWLFGGGDYEGEYPEWGDTQVKWDFTDQFGQDVPLRYGINGHGQNYGYDHMINGDHYHQEAADWGWLYLALLFGEPTWDSHRNAAKFRLIQRECADDGTPVWRTLTVVVDYNVLPGGGDGGIVGIRNGWFSKWKIGEGPMGQPWVS